MGVQLSLRPTWTDVGVTRAGDPFIYIAGSASWSHASTQSGVFGNTELRWCLMASEGDIAPDGGCTTVAGFCAWFDGQYPLR